MRCSLKCSLHVVLLLLGMARAQESEPACGNFGEMQDWFNSMNAVCCGGAGDDCSSGLPTTCSNECATRLLPLQTACANFLALPMNSALQSLINEAASTCPPPPPPCDNFAALDFAMEPVNRICCDEPGEDCSSGFPSTCNDECARALIPFQAAVRDLSKRPSSHYRFDVYLRHRKPYSPRDSSSHTSRWAAFWWQCDTFLNMPMNTGLKSIINHVVASCGVSPPPLPPQMRVCDDSCSAWQPWSNARGNNGICEERLHGAACNVDHSCMCPIGTDSTDCASVPGSTPCSPLPNGHGDPCWLQPCQNGGRCLPASTSPIGGHRRAQSSPQFICRCTAGFAGLRCSESDATDPRGQSEAEPITVVEFFFGTELPEHASLGAILDDGSGFQWDRDGSGLSYGWDCDGDTSVDYSGGRRGLDRDNGLGMNHFDRDGTCGTTENPGRVNWKIAVPNGEYKATVDFGESVVRTDIGGASVACEVEGELVCPGGETNCIFLDQPVIVTDGFFTITGYSHDTGACHSVSLVRLEHADYSALCPVAPGTAAGTVNIGEASTHTSGDCTQHGWQFCDAEFDSPACNPENIYAGDGHLVGIAYAQQSSMPQWDGVYVSSCVEVGFGAQIMADGIRVLGAASDEQVCGVSCTGDYCGTSGALHVYTSGEDTSSMPDYTTFTFTGTVDLPLDDAAIQGDGDHHDTYDGILAFDSKVVKWAALCRSGGGGARDHIVLDTVELKPVAGGSCSSAAAGSPAPPLSVEFYFGTEVPPSACPEGGCTVVLDDGTGFTRDRQAGLDYGWDCDGDRNVDFSGGRRGLGRDNGLGINHFDRDGACPGPVNWQLAVPNGVYLATVDFGEDHYQHECAIEGVVQCPGGEDCVVTQPIEVTDGRFTVTGYSHDSGTCHSISLVKLESGRCHRLLVANGVMGGDPQEHGGDWERGFDAEGSYITQEGTGTFLRFDMPQVASTGDWTSTMRIALINLDGSAATFEFNRNSHFGFEGSCQCVFAEGPFFGDFQDMGDPAAKGIVEGAVLDFVVQRRGTTFTIYVNGNIVQTHTSSEPITSIGLRPHRATMRLYDWTVDWCPPPACQVGQFEVQYFDNSELAGAPVYTVCEDEIHQDWGRAGVPELGGRGDHFSVRWNGRHLFDPSGNWVFTSRSNDGSRVYVDGLLILDRFDELNESVSQSDPQPLLGWHDVTYEFVNLGGEAHAQLSWEFSDPVDMTQSCTYDGPHGPTDEQREQFNSDGTHEGGYFIPGCSSNCVQFSYLESAQSACSVEDTCGGITYEFHPGDAGTALCCDNDGPHPGICGWCFELRHGAAPDGTTTTRASPFGETSWLKQDCISDVDGQLSCQGWGPDHDQDYPIVGSTTDAGSHLGNAASNHIYSLEIREQTVVTIDTCGSSYDTYIRIYDQFLSTEITGCDDCGPCGVQTVLDAMLPAGEYMVVIEGYSGSEGEYSLQVSCTDPASRYSIGCEQTVSGTTVGAQNVHGGASGEHLFDFHLPRETNLVQFDSCESTFDTYLRIFSDGMGEELEGCDDCGDCGLHTVLDAVLPGGDYTLVVEGFSSTEGNYIVVMHCPSEEGFDDGDISCGETKTGTTVNAGSHLGSEAGHHVYHFTTQRGDTVLQFDACASDFDTFLRIRDEDMTEVAACDDCGPCGVQTLLDTVVSCDAEECHFNLVVEGFGSHEGEYSVSMNCPPANPRPAPIVCNGPPVTGSTVGAGSTYLAFTITEPQLVQFDSCASTFDTYLMVMEADTRIIVAQCDNCGNCGDQTVLDLRLDPGDELPKEYLLAVEGAGRVEGDFSISMICPASDFQEGELSCGSEPVTGNTFGADDLSVGNEGGDHMFEFTLTESRMVSFSSCESAFDTHLRVVGRDLSPLEWCEGNACDCDDCGACSTRTVLPFTQYPPGDYALVVSGYGSSSGLYTVDMQCIDGLITCGESTTGRYDGSPKQFKFTVEPDSSGIIQFDTCRSDYATLLRIVTMDQHTELSSCDDCGSCGSRAVLDASLPAGDYILVIEGYGVSEGTYDIAMNCQEQLNAIPVTATAAVQNDGDDGEENLNDNTVSISSDDLELTFDGVRPQLVGIRFSNVQMMPGSAVSEAYITLTIDEINPQSNMPVTLSITAEAAVDSSAIESENSNLSDRATISSSIEWHPEVNLQTRDTLQTPDISSLLSEVAHQPGWQPGNAVLFIVSRVEGQGVRWAKSAGIGAPILTYTYPRDGFTDGTINCGNTVHGSTVSAGQHIGNGASDHIYSFHVPPSRAGMIQFDSCGSTFDTWIRVMSHHMAEELASCDDCGACGTQSIVEVELDPGYYVVVLEGYDASEGEYQLTMTCFGGGREGTISCGQTVFGSTEGVVSSIGNGGGEHFYSFTLDSMANLQGVEMDQLVQFDSCGSTYDTYLRIFSIDLDEEVQSCDDCGDCGLQTVLDASLTAGEYVLVIEGFSSAEGEYSVVMNCPTLDGDDAFLDGSIACGDTVRGTTVGAGSHIGNGASDHVYTFSLPSSSDSQAVQFDSCDSEFDTYLRVTRGSVQGAQLAACDDCGPCGLHTVLDAVLECDITQPNYSTEDDTCEYNLVIEGFGSNEGVYSVTMNCGSEMDGTIACGETVCGSTVDAGSHVGNDASDHLYAFSLDRPSNIQMDSCASSYDTFLRIVDMNLGEEYTSCDDCGNCGLRTVLDVQLEAGDYMLVIEGYGNSEGDYSVTMNCPDQGGGLSLPITESIEVASAEDTAEQQVVSGSIVTDNRDLELSSEQIVGVRFQGVNIAQGAVVTEAVIDFSVSQISALAQQDLSLRIQMESSGDSQAISENPSDLSRRSITVTEARWSPEISLVQYDTLSTPNLNHIMSEVVGLPTWSPGNSILFLFRYLSGQGNRWVKSDAGADFGGSWPAPTLRYTFFETGFADGSIICGDTVIGTTDGAGTHVGNGASDHVYTFDVTPDMIDREHSLAALTFDSCESEFDTYLRIFNVDLTEEITGCDDCGPCGLQTVLNAALHVGQYNLVIEGYGSNEGRYSVVMSCEPFSREIEGRLECGQTVSGNTDGAGGGMVTSSGSHYYTFNMMSQGLVQFDSCDSDYDTFLRVFSDNLDTELDSCDDCGDCGVQTVLDADLPAGSYTLVIEGYADATGQYSVTMNCPVDGEFMDGAIDCGDVVTGSTVSAVSNARSDGGDHLYSFTVPQGSHLVQFDSCDSQFDTFLIIHEADPTAENELGAEVIGCDDCGACGVQTVLDASLQCNDPECSYFLVIEGFGSDEGEYTVAMNCEGDNPDLSIEGVISCNSAPATGSTVGASSNTGGASGDHLWSFSLATQTFVQFDSCASSFDTYLRVTSPDLTTELSGCDDCGDAYCGTHTVLDADLPAGEYVLIVEGYASSEGDYSVQMNCPSTWGAITGFADGDIACGDSVVGTTLEAGSDVGNGASDHIYSFSLSEDQAGFVQFDSCESDFDTYLRIFNADLTDEIAGCDDCGPCGLRTVLDAELPAGDYNLVIEGYSSTEGNYDVAMICPEPGTSSTQGTIECGHTVSGSTEDASNALGNDGGEHLYSFTVPESTLHNFITFDSCESTYDTYLRVMSAYVGNAMEERTGCDDCGDCVLDADLPPGEYILVVEGYASSEGHYSVDMICDAREVDSFEPISCGATVAGETDENTPSNMGYPSGEAMYAFTLMTTQVLQFDSCDSYFDTFLRIASPTLDQELTGCDDCGDCGTHTVLDAELPPGDYVLVIEGFNTETGAYSVTMNCNEDAVFIDGHIDCGDTVHGNTVGAGSHVGNGASDHLYSFHIDSTVLGVTFDSCGSEFDTYLWVLSGTEDMLHECIDDLDNCAAEEAGCDDCGDCGVQSVLTLDQLLDPSTESLDEGDYMLIIEGFSSQEGVYTVTMNCHHEGDPPPSGAVACDAGEHLVDHGQVDKTGGYGHGHDCNWHLSCSDPESSPLLTFSSFSTEANFDFVTIYDGDSNDSPQLGRFHGEELPGGEQRIQSTGPNMLVRLTSDASVTREGFFATFECTTMPPRPNACVPPGLTLQGFASAPQMLDGTAVYDNSVVCDWVITCQGGLAPLLVFQLFDTEANFDFVRVYDGSTNEAYRLANYNGNIEADPVLGSGSTMLVELSTDVSVTQDGFMATFECSPERAPAPAPDACSSVLQLNTPGPIENPYYDNSMTCTWSLVCPVMMPMLTFTSFSTETNYDWVSVYDGTSDTDAMLIHASGDLPPDTAQATGQIMTLIFTTDGSVTRDGFAADFVCAAPGLPPGPPDACTTGLTLVDGGGFSKTNYGHGHLCTWLLTCTNRADAPLLSFSSFNTEMDYGLVTAYRGSEALDANIIGGPWSGSSIPAEVAGDAGSSMLVEFLSDEPVGRDGFVASYSCTTESAPPSPPNACVKPGMTMLDAGVIDQSMYFQGGQDIATGVYTHDLECRWILTCSDRASTPTLTFRSFATEANFDFVRAYDGADADALPLSPGQGWSGNDVPSAVQGRHPQMLLQFITDGSVSQHGWSASFECTHTDSSPPAPPTVSTPVTPVVTASTTSLDGYDTYQLAVTLNGDSTNVYAIYGTPDSPMSVPPAFQQAAPFGANVGGTNPAFWAIMAGAQFDSWLTVGWTEGNQGMLSSIGIDFDAWTETNGLATSDGAIFWMSPELGPSGRDDYNDYNIVLAQITVVEGSTGTASMGVQGLSSRVDGWQSSIEFSYP